jgi:hypothetical protein
MIGLDLNKQCVQAQTGLSKSVRYYQELCWIKLYIKVLVKIWLGKKIVILCRIGTGLTKSFFVLPKTLFFIGVV